MANSKKTAAGCGNIRKEIIRRGGKEYEYWEARYTVGFDPGTGKQVQKSVSGKTQKEVAQKLKAATAALDDGTYIALNKMTVAQWLDTWQNEYLANVKPSTVSSYEATIRNHLQPGLGAIRLDSLTTHDIQEFYNSLHSPSESRNTLSSKTIKNIHGVLHKALQQAMLNNYIRTNPSNPCILPRVTRRSTHWFPLRTARREPSPQHPMSWIFCGGRRKNRTSTGSTTAICFRTTVLSLRTSSVHASHPRHCTGHSSWWSVNWGCLP